LVRPPGANVVLFTGSYDVGHRIQELSAQHFDRIVACEMGSKSAVIVCEDARPDLAVNAALISGFKTSGQRCVSAGRILVAEPLFDRFASAPGEKARRLRIGEPLDAHNFTRPGIHKGWVEKVESYNRLARQEGAKVLLDGGRMTSGAHGAGCYMAPFLYKMEYGPNVRCIREEVFGPHLALIPFRT